MSARNVHAMLWYTELISHRHRYAHWCFSNTHMPQQQVQKYQSHEGMDPIEIPCGNGRQTSNTKASDNERKDDLPCQTTLPCYEQPSDAMITNQIRVRHSKCINWKDLWTSKNENGPLCTHADRTEQSLRLSSPHTATKTFCTMSCLVSGRSEGSGAVPKEKRVESREPQPEVMSQTTGAHSHAITANSSDTTRSSTRLHSCTLRGPTRDCAKLSFPCLGLGQKAAK